MAPQENHERHPNPNALKLNTRAKGQRYPRRNVCPPKRFCVLHGESTRESRTRKRAWRFRLPTPSPTVSDSDDGATSASSTVQLLPTIARLTAVQLDKGTTSAHQSAAILQRILEQRVSIARHAYEMCVPEVMESVSGFMLRSGQGVGAPKPVLEPTRGEASDSADEGAESQHRGHTQLLHLRDSWASETLPVGLQRLRDVVVGHPYLERAWTKYAAYRGLATWMEVSESEALEFQSTCATVLEQLHDHPDTWHQCLPVDRVIGLPCVATTSTTWEGICDSESGLGALPERAPRTTNGAALWIVQPQHEPETLLERLDDPAGVRTYVLAIPDDRNDWLTAVRALCIEGTACSMAGSFLSHTHRFHSVSKCATPYIYKVWPSSKSKNETHCDRTVVCGTCHSRGGIATMHPLRCPSLHRQFLQLDRAATLRVVYATNMPPRDRYPTSGAARERHLFATAWTQLARERQGLFRKGLRRRDLAEHLQQVRSLLPFSGKSWFRKVYGMSKAWSFPYHRKGCLVYAVVNDLNGHVYVGQTGGREHLRSMVQRFKEHVLGGINFERRKHRYDPSEWSLYEAMHKLGVHHFFIVPLEVVDKCEVDAKEHAWIAKFGGRVYNRSSDSKWRSQRNMKRFFQTPRPLPRGDLTVLANRYVQMSSPPLPEMMNLWTRSESRLPQALRRSLWDRLIAVARDTHGIKLPRRLVFPHPPCDPTELQDLRMLVYGLIAELPAPKALKSYLRAVTVFVARRCSAVRDVLCTKGTNLSWSQLQQRSTMSCQCASLPADMPRVDGCVAVRDIRQLRVLFPSKVGGLLQNMSNSVLGSVDTYVTQARQSVWRAAKACPFLPASWRSSIVEDAMHLTTKLYHTVAGKVPESLQREHLLSAKRHIPLSTT